MPRQTKVREFSGNTAHSNFDGFMFDRGPKPDGTFSVGARAEGGTRLVWMAPLRRPSREPLDSDGIDRAGDGGLPEPESVR